MGYYTRYTLSITPNTTEEQDKQITEFLVKDCFGCELNTEDDHYKSWLEEEMKWYDHDKDMLELSKKFPDFLFALDGEGEENGDIWTKWYKNGKSQFEKAKLIHGEFNENKLK